MGVGLSKGISGLDVENVYNGAVGNIGINGVVFDVNTEDRGYASFQIAAPAGGALPGAGTMQIEGTIDGNTWVAANYAPAAAGAVTAVALVLTVAGIWVINVAPYRRVRGRLTVATTGATVLPYLTLLVSREGVRLV